LQSRNVRADPADIFSHVTYLEKKLPRYLEMSVKDRASEAMGRSMKLLPADAAAVIEAMLTPESLAIIATTLAVWAGSHFFGIGEIVDVILLIVGVVALGFSVFSGAEELYEFTGLVVNPKQDSDADAAARHFAKAVTLLGISAIQAILLRGAVRTVAARGRPQIRPLPNVGTPPPPGNQLRVTRPASIAGGSLGTTDAYGAISIARNQSISEQQLTLYHELVHRWFSPKMGPFRQLRAQLAMSGYNRSSILMYLEEALAEGYGQLRMNGVAAAFGAYKFPIQGGYVTVSQLASEGTMIGRIILGGAAFNVFIGFGPIPGAPPR
jgi:hypothetical protein